MPTSGTTGWGDLGAFAPRRIVAADRVTANTFYMWNYIYGFFASSDSRTTWTNYNNYGGASTPATMDPTSAYAYLKSVPSNAGHLFFSRYSGSGGSYTTPNTASRFWRSTDGGQTWAIVGPSSSSSVGAIVEVWAFGFGAAAPGQTYPAVYIYGWMYNGSAYVQALYSSLDNCVTWAKIGEQYPDGWTDWVKDLTGDMSNYGWVYIAKSGSNFGDPRRCSARRRLPSPPNSGQRRTRMIGY